MWKDLSGYDKPYRVSDSGRFQYFEAGEWHDMTVGRTHGTAQVHFRQDGRSKSKVAGRIVFEAFRRPLKPGEIVMCKDGFRLDIDVTNLIAVPRKTGSSLGGKVTRREVEKIDKDGNVLYTYGSIEEAAKGCHCSTSAVLRRCRKKIKDPFMRMDFSFRYAKGEYYSKKEGRK